MNRQDVSRETQQLLGFTPGFIQSIPDEHVGPLWESMRKLQMDEGAIPAKYQQLIMLAVATYAKCKYCTDFHTEIARVMGASSREITETALLTGNTAMWSNYLGGTQYDFDAFRREVRTAATHVANMLKQNGGKRARV